MKRQQGAVLVVVLSLLTVSLMVGLSSMQTSQIDERLAGNYKAAVEAQMAAEEAAASGWKSAFRAKQFSGTSLDVLKGLSWDEFLDNSNFEEDVAEGGCGNASCYYRHIRFDGNYYIVAMGGVDDGGVSVSEPIIVLLDYEPGGLILGAEAALTCIGPNCKFFAKTKPTVIDGRDYNASVDTAGHIKDEHINPDGQAKAAYVVPDGGVVELGNATVEGDLITNKEAYNNYGGLSTEWDGVDGAEARIKNEIDSMIELGKAGDPRVTYWDSGSSGTFAMPSSGIVVVNGTDLVANVSGNFKFTGLVIVKDGIFDLKQGGDGTTSIVGAIIAQDATVDMQNGNPSLLYSSEALCQAEAIAGGDCSDEDGVYGGSKDFTINSWF